MNKACTYLLAWVILPVSVFASRPDSLRYDSLQRLYPFLIIDENFIHNARVLNPLFDTLYTLEKGGNRAISIFQIGDSHIQAGTFPESMRKGLQSRFGRAGRGLVFPYRLAGTNGPDDLDMASNGSWTSRRNAIIGKDIPTGISGFGLRTREKHAILSVGLKESADTLDYFDRISLFLSGEILPGSMLIYENKDTGLLEKISLQDKSEHYLIKKGDNLSTIAARQNTTVAFLKQWNNLRSDRIQAGQKLLIKANKPVAPIDLSALDILGNFSVHPSGVKGVLQADLPKAIRTCILGFAPDSPLPEEWVVQGISLERRDRQGIVYHMAAVNGAQFKSFLLSENFFPQLRALAPKGIIVSLGTNESMEAGLDTMQFRRELGGFIDSLRQLPSAPILLLTLPGDNLIRRKQTNSRLSILRSIMIQVAFEKGVAWWDLYKVMGGERSIEAWYRAGLAAPDHLHLTRKGYELQSSLLLKAFMEAYQRRVYELE